MSCAVAAGCNPAARLQLFCGHRAGTETRSDLNTHPGIFRQSFQCVHYPWASLDEGNLSARRVQKPMHHQP